MINYRNKTQLLQSNLKTAPIWPQIWKQKLEQYDQIRGKSSGKSANKKAKLGQNLIVKSQSDFYSELKYQTWMQVYTTVIHCS